MAANDKELKKAKGGVPAPQYYNPDIDVYQVQTGRDGASDMYLVGSGRLICDLVTVTTPGTRVQFPNIPCREILIIALDTNTGAVYVGDSQVTKSRFGAKLRKEGYVTLSVKNANMVYIDAEVGGEGISYAVL